MATTTKNKTAPRGGSTATRTTTPISGGGGGQAAPLGIPSGGASVSTATTQSTVGGVNWGNVQQQFPTIAWNQTQLEALMTSINLGPQHYSHGEYQAMLTSFRAICGQQVALFERLHLGKGELVNA